MEKRAETDGVCIVDNEHPENKEWRLSISNAITGEKKIEGMVQGRKAILNTENWPSGIYVIKAMEDGYTASEKIYLN